MIVILARCSPVFLYASLMYLVLIAVGMISLPLYPVKVMVDAMAWFCMMTLGCTKDDR